MKRVRAVSSVSREKRTSHIAVLRHLKRRHPAALRLDPLDIDLRADHTASGTAPIPLEYDRSRQSHCVRVDDVLRGLPVSRTRIDIAAQKSRRLSVYQLPPVDVLSGGLI